MDELTKLATAAGCLKAAAPKTGGNANGDSSVFEQFAKHQLPKFDQVLSYDDVQAYSDLATDYLNHHSDTRVTNSAVILTALCNYVLNTDEDPHPDISRSLKLLMRTCSDT